MRQLRGLCWIGALTAWLPASAGAGEAAWKWTAEAVADTVAVGHVALAPDGGSVVFTRTRSRPAGASPGAGHANLWRVPFAGGEPQRLTLADAEDQRPSFSPDGSRLAYLSKRGGDPKGGGESKARLLVLPLTGGEAAPLTGERVSVSSFEWSPDGSRIAYVAEDPKDEQREEDEKAGRDQVVVDQQLRPRRIWVHDLTRGRAEPLAALGSLSAWSFGWAPDGTALVATVSERNRTDDSYFAKRIVVLPLSGPLRELVPQLGKLGAVAWSRDGRTIAWLAGVDASDPFAGSLFVVPAAGGTPRNLTRDRAQTDVAFDWRADGKLAVVSAAGTGSSLHLVDPESGRWEPVALPGGLAFSSLAWSASGDRYALAGSTARHPADVFAGERSSGAPSQPRRLAQSNPQLAGLPLGAQETIRWRARDGLEIEGVLVKPAASQRPLPLAVILHGGPESHQLDGWINAPTSPSQALAERGFAVLLPNYRGSTGRGVAFAKADHRDLGGKELTDVLDGVDHLVAQGSVDRARVGILGGSYGGYLTALAVTRHSDRFAAGVDLFGITSWESFLGQTDIPVENSLVHWALWCYEHAALCRERSAIGNLATARTPTLILQGAKDLRVPKAQSDELYAALRHAGVPVEYVVYPREEHGFRERWHRIDAFDRLVGWLERWVRDR